MQDLQTDAEGLLRLVYVSTATVPFGRDDLLALVRPIRVRNQVNAVTGLLVYDEGRFLQLLEGPQDEVEATFQRIRVDPRHRDVTVLFRAAARSRMFGEWQMGLVRLDDLPPERHLGLVDFVRFRLLPGSEDSTSAEEAWSWFEEFRERALSRATDR
ncbi:MAG: BLUF domain-containing protein [Gemmatimonadota bacterium]